MWPFWDIMYFRFNNAHKEVTISPTIMSLTLFSVFTLDFRETNLEYIVVVFSTKFYCRQEITVLKHYTLFFFLHELQKLEWFLCMGWSYCNLRPFSHLVRWVQKKRLSFNLFNMLIIHHNPYIYIYIKQPIQCKIFTF